MIKTFLLKYYYVWFQGHKRSRYAHQFSHHWFRAFAQVCISAFFWLVIIAYAINKTFMIDSFHFGKYIGILLYGILPACILYYLLFHCFGANQNNDDPSHLGISITKKTKIVSWIIFILSPLILMLMIAFWR